MSTLETTRTNECPDVRPELEAAGINLEKKYGWMVLGEISPRPEASCNGLLVAPGGYRGNDDNTEILACLLAEELDCFAVVNNQKYNPLAKLPFAHRADLNDKDEAFTCRDFRKPLLDRTHHITEWYTKPPLVLVVTGMGDLHAEGALGSEGVFALGAGYEGSYDAETATASLGLINALRKALTEEIGPAKDGVTGYDASDGLVSGLKNELKNEKIEAVQIAIRCMGYRDSLANIRKLVTGLKDILTSEGFRRWFTTERRKKPIALESSSLEGHEANGQPQDDAGPEPKQEPTRGNSEPKDSEKGVAINLDEGARFFAPVLGAQHEIQKETAPESQSSWEPDPSKRGEITVKKDGICNILVVAPHGFPGDDTRTEDLAIHLAEKLDCYAVVNNWKYKKPNCTSKREGIVADLNNPDDAEKHADDWWNPILRMAQRITLKYSCPAIVAVIHGMKDLTAESNQSVFLLGAAYDDKDKNEQRYDPSTATIGEETRNSLMEQLQAKLGPGKDGVYPYGATTTIVPELVDTLKWPVQAFQLEIKRTGFRNNDSAILSTAHKLANVLKSLTGFRRLAPEQEVSAMTERTSPTEQYERVPFDKIQVVARHRKDLGDIVSLAASIGDVGLINPLTVDSEYILLSGRRRLEALKLLGWKDVPVHILDTENPTALEHDENVHRKPFAPSEAVSIGRAVEEIERTKAKERQRLGGRPGKGEEKRGAKLAPDSKGKTRDKVSQIVGIKRTTFTKARKIVEAAEEEPQKYARLMEEMDRTGKIDRAYRELVKTGYVQKGAEDWSEKKFNATNENIEWAKWTWNPVTGCKHGCPYCYAREAANLHYTQFPADQRFDPRLWEERLRAPSNTKIPKDKQAEPGWKHVFVCSMADLFGEWVEESWINKVLNVCRDSPQWTYIFLTKNPSRLPTITFPKNCWVGTTVDGQKRVVPALDAMAQVKATVRFISCEPLLEDLTFPTLEAIDWIIVGAQRKTVHCEGIQPKWEWVRHLEQQARDAKKPLYIKPNLDFQAIRPREYPTEK
jgi:protein gp37/ParB-like chromosome segregation protein Spo0J